MAALLVSLALGCEHCERGLGRPLPKSCTGRDVHDIDYEAPFELRGEHAACLPPRLGWQSFAACAVSRRSATSRRPRAAAARLEGGGPPYGTRLI